MMFPTVELRSCRFGYFAVAVGGRVAAAGQSVRRTGTPMRALTGLGQKPAPAKPTPAKPVPVRPGLLAATGRRAHQGSPAGRETG
ncbi:MAG TPA: hypothetical protein VMA72_15195 [Streptosporangiaceae bacterium]|nr:hypothetical protein [Streptosporangiaceae bacterium]